MAETSIEWTDATWNPVRGCSIVSPGCHNCYAMKQANRFDFVGGAYEGLTKPGPHGPQWSGQLFLVPDKLQEPLSWRKPKMVFVNSMSDLFHEDVPDKFIRMVFAVMSLSGQHTFQVLTKRAERMAAWFADPENSLSACQAEWAVAEINHGDETPTGKSRIRNTRSINGAPHRIGDGNHWPLPNVWLGVSVEDQQRADERIPHLLATPAAVRFLSCEPLLGSIDLQLDHECGDPPHGRCPPVPDWVIVGGESGPKARPCGVEWIESLIDQCRAAGVPCFVKQMGSKLHHDWGKCEKCGKIEVGDGWDVLGAETHKVFCTDCHAEGYHEHKLKDRKGGNPDEWPADLRVREFPPIGVRGT